MPSTVQKRLHFIAALTSNKKELVSLVHPSIYPCPITFSIYVPDAKLEHIRCKKNRFPKQYLNFFFFIPADPEGPGFAAMVLTFLSIVLIVITMPFSLCLVIKVNKFKN